MFFVPDHCTGQQSEIIEKRQKNSQNDKKKSKKRLPERCFLSSTTGSRSPVLPGPPLEVTEDPNWWGVDRAGCGVGLWWPPRPRCEVGPPVAAPTKNTNKNGWKILYIFPIFQVQWPKFPHFEALQYQKTGNWVCQNSQAECKSKFWDTVFERCVRNSVVGILNGYVSMKNKVWLTIPGPACRSGCLTVEHSKFVIDGIGCGSTQMVGRLLFGGGQIPQDTVDRGHLQLKGQWLKINNFALSCTLKLYLVFFFIFIFLLKCKLYILETLSN